MTAESCISKPKVSVHLITFNQVDFVGKAIERVLSQETNFPFELVIGEDCSSDGTREIVKSYADNNRDIIRTLLHRENLGRNGENNFIETLKACRGDYIAFVEGDDYWTSPEKLQIQADFLDKNPETVACFHNALVVDQFGEIIDWEWFNEARRARVKNISRFNRRDCLLMGSSYPSCSLMVRRSAIEHLPDWYLQSPTDLATDVLISGYGDLTYIPLNMAAYRVHPGGIWQGKSELSNRIEILERYRRFHKVPEIEGEHSDLLVSVMKWQISSIMYLSGRDRVRLPFYLIYSIIHQIGICRVSARLIFDQLRFRYVPEFITKYRAQRRVRE